MNAVLPPHRRHLPRRSRVLLATLAGVVLAVLAGLRVLGEDRDYQQYLFVFEAMRDGALAADETRFEPGFILFNRLALLLGGGNFTVLLIGVALVSLTLKFRLLASYGKLAPALLVYVLVLLPLHEMTQIRVALALAFSYVAIAYNLEHPATHFNGRSLALLALGATFQASVLVLLPFSVGFTQRIFRRPTLCFVTFGLLPSAAVWLLMRYFVAINPLIVTYINAADEYAANPLSARNITLIVLVCIGAFSLDRMPPSRRPWYFLSLMGVCLWYGMIAVPVFAHRLLELTLMACLFWIPVLPRSRRLASWALLILFSLYQFYSLIMIDPLFT